MPRNPKTVTVEEPEATVDDPAEKHTTRSGALQDAAVGYRTPSATPTVTVGSRLRDAADED